MVALSNAGLPVEPMDRANRCCCGSIYLRIRCRRVLTLWMSPRQNVWEAMFTATPWPSRTTRISLKVEMASFARTTCTTRTTHMRSRGTSGASRSTRGSTRSVAASTELPRICRPYDPQCAVWSKIAISISAVPTRGSLVRERIVTVKSGNRRTGFEE